MKTLHTPTPQIPWDITPAAMSHYLTTDDQCACEDCLEVKRVKRAVNAHEELLAACKDYLEDLRNHGGTWTIERLKQAIAKAEGK